jgi:hypothetical protein
MKKIIQEEKEYYLMLAAVMSPLNRAQTFEYTYHQNFGFIMTLGS